MSEKAHVIVIGGGISGLATAWWLHKASVDVVVLEENSMIGGTMQTVQDNGWLVEKGPNSALETTPLFKTLFEDVSISDAVVYAAAAGNNRYIVRNGRLHALPMTAGAFLRSGLWSRAAKLRLPAELFIGRAKEEETVAQFVRRRLGVEFLDYAINPFVAGVFAGNPEQLSVRAAFPKLYALEEKYGGLIRGQILGARERKKRQEKAKDRARMFSFRNGMQTLPEAIGAKLGDRVMKNVRVTRISRLDSEAGPGYRITAVRGGQECTFDAKAAVTAVPSFVAATLIEGLDATLAESLRSIHYPPVVEVFQGYDSAHISRALDGFGYLIPEKEKRSILGTIWSSALFPGRAPERHVALTTFLGGARQPELTVESDGTLADLATKEIDSLMGLTGAPIYTSITRWPRAIPQYRIGHLAIDRSMGEFERRYPGIFLSGNYRGGISVGDCIMSSDRVVREVLGHLDGSNRSHRTSEE